jgi:hypothetical protein
MIEAMADCTMSFRVYDIFLEIGFLEHRFI